MLACRQTSRCIRPGGNFHLYVACCDANLKHSIMCRLLATTPSSDTVRIGFKSISGIM